MTMQSGAARLVRPRTSANGRPQAEADGGSFNVEIESDPVLRTCQWFHFGVRTEHATPIRIANAGSSTYPRGWKDSVVWTLPARGSWQPSTPTYLNGVLAFPHAGAATTVSYALFPPYPLRRLEKLAERVRARRDGDIVEADEATGSALRFSLGDRNPSARQIWVVCGQHGNEHPAIWFADGFVDALVRRAKLPPGIRFHIVPVANPQGMKAGHLRANATGQDPNRHWGEPHACREVDTLLEAMIASGVDILLDVHTDFEMGCVYLDVLDEWMETPADLVAVRERFERRFADRSADVAIGRRYPWSAAPHPDLLAGMCAPAIERRFGAAAITLELPIGRHRDASERQDIWTPRHSRALGRAAAAVLMESA